MVGRRYTMHGVVRWGRVYTYRYKQKKMYIAASKSLRVCSHQEDNVFIFGSKETWSLLQPNGQHQSTSTLRGAGDIQ